MRVLATLSMLMLLGGCSYETTTIVRVRDPRTVAVVLPGDAGELPPPSSTLEGCVSVPTNVGWTANACRESSGAARFELEAFRDNRGLGCGIRRGRSSLTPLSAEGMLVSHRRAEETADPPLQWTPSSLTVIYPYRYGYTSCHAFRDVAFDARFVIPRSDLLSVEQIETTDRLRGALAVTIGGALTPLLGYATYHFAQSGTWGSASVAGVATMGTTTMIAVGLWDLFVAHTDRTLYAAAPM
jgi:hypothetical protein